MKQIKIYVIGLLLLISGFIACQKEKMQNPTNTSEFQYDVQSLINYSNIKTESKGFKGSNGSDQILVFKDMETFRATLSELERQTKGLDNAFVDFYSYLDEEAINKKEEDIGFNEEKPLFDFDNYLGFNSLYQKIAIEEEQWLSQEELDMQNDPDNHFIVEEELRSLLNLDGEVQIGNSIYKLTEDGYFEIVNGDLKSLLLLYSSNKNYQYLPKNIIFVGDENPNLKSSDCNSGKRKSGYKESGDRKIKWVIIHRTNPWGSRVAIAKTKNYKKRKRRGWKKYRTYCIAQVTGYISGKDSVGNADCTVKVNFNPNNYYAHEFNKKRVKHKIDVSTKTKSGWIKGYHFGAGGREFKSTLTW